MTLLTETGTTRLSTKGQCVIPEAIRDRLGLVEGTNFVVYIADGMVVLKPVLPPDGAELAALLHSVRSKAESLGITDADIATAVTEARGSVRDPHSS